MGAPTRSQINHDKLWKSRFGQLSKFKQKHGHVTIPHRELQLYMWVYTQKRHFKNHILLPERRIMLDELGVDWGVPSTREEIVPPVVPTPTGDLPLLAVTHTGGSYHDSLWDAKFIALSNFKKANGHTNPKVTEDGPLHSWVYRQKSLHGENKLSKERCDKLESLAFDWDRGGRKRAYHDVKPAASNKWNMKDQPLKPANIEDPGSPIRSMPTYTTVYTADLHEMAAGLANKTMDIQEAVEKLNSMARVEREQVI